MLVSGLILADRITLVLLLLPLLLLRDVYGPSLTYASLRRYDPVCRGYDWWRARLDRRHRSSQTRRMRGAIGFGGGLILWWLLTVCAIAVTGRVGWLAEALWLGLLLQPAAAFIPLSSPPRSSLSALQTSMRGWVEDWITPCLLYLLLGWPLLVAYGWSRAVAESGASVPFRYFAMRLKECMRWLGQGVSSLLLLPPLFLLEKNRTLALWKTRPPEQKKNMVLSLLTGLYLRQGQIVEKGMGRVRLIYLGGNALLLFAMAAAYWRV